MQLVKINIKNICGITELSFSPQGINEITGANGTGKTSVLSALQTALKGGAHTAWLRRQGAEEGEVVLVYDDTTTITKTIGEDKSTFKVKQQGKAVRSGATLVDALRDMVATNPVEMLFTNSKRRLEIVMEAATFDVSPDSVATITGTDVPVTPDNVLDVIESERARLYEERTYANRAAKDCEATVETLQAAITPLPEGVDLTADYAQQLLEGGERYHADIEAIEQELNTVRTETQRAEFLEIQRITEQRDADIAEATRKIREEAERGLEAVRQKSTAIRDAATAKAEHQRAQATEMFTAFQTPLIELRTQQEEYRKIEERQTLVAEQIDEYREKSEELRATSEMLTAQLDRLEALRLSLLDTIPFPGITIEKGEVYLDGVPFEAVNTARKITAAIDIALHRALSVEGNMRVVCVDGLEMMDAKTRQHFIDVATEAAKKGVQFFVTRVTDSPVLSVENEKGDLLATMVPEKAAPDAPKAEEPTPTPTQTAAMPWLPTAQPTVSRPPMPQTQEDDEELI